MNFKSKLICFFLSIFILNAFSQVYKREVSNCLNSQQIKNILQNFDEDKNKILTEWKELAKIYSPSGNEILRAKYIVNKFKQNKINNAYIDGHGNVVGLIDSKTAGSTIVFLGTMDDLATVAEMVKSWEKPIVEKDGKLLGPGTNSSATCVSILGLAKLFTIPEIQFTGKIYLVGVVQEETGLTGVKGFLADHPDVDYLVDIMAGIERISYGALGIHWFKIHFKGPRGHTLSGGLPNVTRGVARAVDQIFSIPIPKEPPEKSSYLNISMLGAGKVFNHRYDDGWFSVDLRSMDNNVLLDLKDQIFKIADNVAKEEKLEYWVEKYSQSPAGQIPGARDSKFIRIAEEATKLLGSDVSLSNRGSSNMNIGISNNILSISTGGDRGSGRDTPEEYANIEPVLKGIKLDFLIGYIMAEGKLN